MTRLIHKVNCINSVHYLYNAIMMILPYYGNTHSNAQILGHN